MVRLGDGDLLVMGGESQSTHKHELLRPGRAPEEKTGRRINLTFRVFQELCKSRDGDDSERACRASDQGTRGGERPASGQRKRAREGT